MANTNPMGRQSPGTDSSGLTPGYVLNGRYKLVCSIGKGGMAQIFEALDLKFKKRVAVKILHRTVAENEITVKRFLSEAAITSSLQHSNIVRLNDSGVTSEGHRYLIMELLSGEPLSSWADRVDLEEKNSSYIQKLVSIILGVCAGLEKAHEKGIIHRDLKPSNIFLQADKSTETSGITPKILDFGVARRMDLDITRMTLTGDICGTTEYISPELVMGQEPDIRSDIYALGIVIYKTLTGTTPFRADESALVFRRAIDGNFIPKSPMEINSSVTRKLNQICLKAIERDPDKRYQSAAELADALIDMGQMDVPRSTPKALDGAGSGFTPRLRVILPIMIVLCLVALSIFFWPEEIGRQPAQEMTVKKTGIIKQGQPAKPKKTASVIDNKPPSAISEPEPIVDNSQTVNKTPQVERSAQDVLIKSTSVKPEGRPRTKDYIAARQQAKILVDKGYEALGQNHFDEAAQLFERARKTDPRMSRAFFGLGQVAFQQGRYDDSVTKIRGALSLSPENIGWRIYLGRVFHAMDERDKAAQEWQRVLAQDPGNKKAKDLLARIGAVKE